MSDKKNITTHFKPVSAMITNEYKSKINKTSKEVEYESITFTIRIRSLSAFKTSNDPRFYFSIRLKVTSYEMTILAL